MNITTRIYTALFGELVGKDEFLNSYFRTSRFVRSFGRENRWVVYNGQPFPSKVPSNWFLWLHYQSDLPPMRNEAIRKNYHWDKQHMPNLTGTVSAYSPMKNVTNVVNKKTYVAWRAN